MRILGFNCDDGEDDADENKQRGCPWSYELWALVLMMCLLSF